MNTFTVEPNSYLNIGINAFFHTDYVGYREDGNPDYLNVLKNDFNDRSKPELQDAAANLIEQLTKDLPEVVKDQGWDKALICSMPRAKSKDTYQNRQLLFTQVVSVVSENLKSLEDGTDLIIRHTSTRTTHLKYSDDEGKMPYEGIAKDTCKIDDRVKGKNIILVDDIYTKTINVDEDMIQALLDAGAKNVALYVVAKTLYRKQSESQLVLKKGGVHGLFR